MTDVSAGALAAGTGALPGLGKPPGATVGTSEFETELNAFADAVPGELPGGQGGGEVSPAFAALFTPGEAAFGPAANGGLPEAAGPAGSAPGPAPEIDGADGVPVPSGASASLPGSFVPLAGTPASAPDSGAPDLPESSGQRQADPLQASTQPAPPSAIPLSIQRMRPSAVLFNQPETGPEGASSQSPTPVPPVQPGGHDQVTGLSNAPVTPSPAAASVPGAQQVAGPAPASQTTSIIETDAIVPEGGPAANTARLTDAAPRSSENVLSTSQQWPAQGAVPGPAAQTAAQLPLNGRRWQTELPSELRAPVPSFQRTAETVPQSQVPAASVPAGNTQSPPLASSQPVAGAVQAPAAPAAAAQPIVLSEAATDATQPFNSEPVDGPAGPGASKSGNANDTSGAAPVIQAARQLSQTAGAEPLTTHAAADPSPEAEPDGFEPVSLKVEATANDKKAPAQGPGSQTQTAGQGGQPGAGAGAQPAANAGDARPQAVPVAAAVVAAQLPLDDPEAVTEPIDLTTTGDFVATVRGGETQGAVRTESLQTPNQAQSGQVATQVAAEIARNLKNGQTRFQMRFDPPELGRVDVNMRVGADGGVHAHLIVERPETLDMFLRDQRGLERALEAAGLNADSENLQFSLKQEGGRDFASGDGQGEQAAQAGEDANGSQSDDLDAETEAVIRLALAESRGGLDVMI
ncbi:MAG: flagellar hook-length control protein FliK [Pseudomonadota bacterium]